jgi:hypothetical protein
MRASGRTLTLVCTGVAAACAGTAPHNRLPEREPMHAAEPVEVAVRVCVVTDSGPAWADATYREAEGDTVVWTGTLAAPWREHFARIHPYGRGRPWFERGTALRLPGSHSLRDGRRTAPEEMEFVPFSERREVEITPDKPAPGVLERVGRHDGVPLFAEVGMARPPEHYYVAIEPGCTFRPYIKAIWY